MSGLVAESVTNCYITRHTHGRCLAGETPAEDWAESAEVVNSGIMNVFVMDDNFIILSS